MTEALVWTVTLMLLLTGLVGSVIPLIPGPTLILAAVLLHKIALPEYLTWGSVVICFLLYLLTIAVDVLSTVVGARVGGGGRWGMAGAAGGSLVGAFISIPAVILGSILGASLAESLGGRKDPRRAALAGLGAGVGFLVGTVVRVVLVGLMLALVTLDVAFTLAARVDWPL